MGQGYHPTTEFDSKLGKKAALKRWENHIKLSSAEHQDKRRFGGLKKIVLERDDFKCVRCGMTSEEHLKKWNRGITVDHIDGNGRYSKNPKNTLDNLQTLCLACHGSKDATKHGKYAVYHV